MNLTSSPHDYVVFPNALQHCVLLLRDGSVEFCHNNWFISSVPVAAIVNGDLPDVTGTPYFLKSHFSGWWQYTSDTKIVMVLPASGLFHQPEEAVLSQRQAVLAEKKVSLGRLHSLLSFVF